MSIRSVVFLVVILLFAAMPWLSQAFGPNVIDDEGIVTWELPVVIDVEADLVKECSVGADKDLAGFVPDAIAVWTGAPETALTVTQQVLLDVNSDPASVDASNVCDFFFDPAACPIGVGNPNGPGQETGSSPIVFDEDGSITELFFGSGSRFQTLGFAGIIAWDPVALRAIKGEGVMNLTCMADCDTPLPCSVTFDDADVLAFVVHELGHFFGMNHTQVNVGQPDQTHRATMNAVFAPNSTADITTLERDDQVGIGYLYPQDPDILAENFCTVTGTVRDENDDEFQCANVIVRNVDTTKELEDVISFVSGGDLPGRTTEAGRGRFTIPGLTPGNSYQLTVKPIDTTGVLSQPASGIIPCNGGRNPRAPSFDEKVLDEIIACQPVDGETELTVNAAEILDVGDIVIANSSGNVAAIEEGEPAGPAVPSVGGSGCSLVWRR